MKNRKWLTVILAAALLVVAGCSTSESKEGAAAKESTEQSTKKETQKDYSFYKDAKSNSRIYYKVDLEDKSFGKDSKIDAIIHVDHGDYTLYSLDSPDKTYTMSDLKGLSDKEILTAAADWNKETMLALVSKAKADAQETLDTEGANQARKDTATKNLDLLNNYSYEKPAAKKLEVKIESDDTGNNTGKEWIVLPTYDSQIKYYKVDGAYEGDTRPDLQIYYPGDKLFRYQLSPTQQTAEVYDKTYSLSSFGKNYTMATVGTAAMSLDDLNEKGLREKSANSEHFKVGKNVEGEKFIIWE